MQNHAKTSTTSPTEVHFGRIRIHYDTALLLEKILLAELHGLQQDQAAAKPGSTDEALLTGEIKLVRKILRELDFTMIERGWKKPQDG
jgi:hypothetical protein